MVLNKNEILRNTNMRMSDSVYYRVLQSTVEYYRVLYMFTFCTGNWRCLCCLLCLSSHISQPGVMQYGIDNPDADATATKNEISFPCLKVAKH